MYIVVMVPCCNNRETVVCMLKGGVGGGEGGGDNTKVVGCLWVQSASWSTKVSITAPKFATSDWKGSETTEGLYILKALCHLYGSNLSWRE